jgi:hypothetical protein
MSTAKISQLTALGAAPATDDLMVIVDSSATETKYVTVENLFTSPTVAGATVTGTVSFSGATITNGGSITTVDINGGTIDGTTIGATTAAEGTFTTMTATTANATTVDSTNLEVTNIKAKDGTSAGSIADTTGVVTINSAVLTTADINGGALDGSVIGASSAAAGTFTDLAADAAQITTYRSAVYELTGTDIDPSNGDIQFKTLSGNVTFTESLESGDSVLLFLINGSSYTVTWPANFVWVSANGDVAPTLTANDAILITQVGTGIRAVYVGSYE